MGQVSTIKNIVTTMTNKLSEEIVANTLRMSQSLIGETQSELMQDKDKGIKHTFRSSETDATILFFISEGVSFGCYFPTDDDCKLVNTPLLSKDTKAYRNYCNSQYETHETDRNSWYNRKLKTFITIFFDTDEDSYMLNVMDMTESDS